MAEGPDALKHIGAGVDREFECAVFVLLLTAALLRFTVGFFGRRSVIWRFLCIEVLVRFLPGLISGQSHNLVVTYEEV